ncbi:MAG: helix-turn-helix domain-containing protein [Candidatus Woesearchaeota archaeon]
MEALRALGLTEIEEKVYLTLIEEGPSLAGHISRKSGIHRRMVYDATERLIKKGLVSYIMKNNRRLFEAAEPDRLLQIVQEQEEAIKRVLPQLKLAHSMSKEKQETQFFKGHAGVKGIFEDEIKEGKELLILSASPSAREMFPAYFHWFDVRRKQKGIKARILADTKHAEKFSDAPLAEVRHIAGLGNEQTSTNIYADKVAIIFWNKEKPFVVLIKQKEIADAYRDYFEQMWKMAKK